MQLRQIANGGVAIDEWRAGISIRMIIEGWAGVLGAILADVIA